MIFTTYVLMSPSNILTPYKAFVIISLINMVNQMAIQLPSFMSITAQVGLFKAITHLNCIGKIPQPSI